MQDKYCSLKDNRIETVSVIHEFSAAYKFWLWFTLTLCTHIKLEEKKARQFLFVGTWFQLNMSKFGRRHQKLCSISNDKFTLIKWFNILFVKNILKNSHPDSELDINMPQISKNTAWTFIFGPQHIQYEYERHQHLLYIFTINSSVFWNAEITYMGTCICSTITAKLTHICLMDFSIFINWTSLFRILGVSGVLFHFYSISNRNSCKQTVNTLIRRRVLWRLILVCTVCLCPKYWTLGLNGLNGLLFGQKLDKLLLGRSL